MLQFLLCLFGLHGATVIDYTVDNEEIKVCRDCLKEVDLFWRVLCLVVFGDL